MSCLLIHMECKYTLKTIYQGTLAYIIHSVLLGSTVNCSKTGLCWRTQKEQAYGEGEGGFFNVLTNIRGDDSLIVIHLLKNKQATLVHLQGGNLTE